MDTPKIEDLDDERLEDLAEVLTALGITDQDRADRKRAFAELKRRAGS